MTRSVSSSEDSERRDRLVRSGVIRPGTGGASGLLAENPVEVQTSVLDALIEERADRREVLGRFGIGASGRCRGA